MGEEFPIASKIVVKFFGIDRVTASKLVRAFKHEGFPVKSKKALYKYNDRYVYRMEDHPYVILENDPFRTRDAYDGCLTIKLYDVCFNDDPFHIFEDIDESLGPDEYTYIRIDREGVTRNTKE